MNPAARTRDQIARDFASDPAFDLEHATRSTPSPTSNSWPKPLGPRALIGLAGDVVRMIDPTTESDQAAILYQFMAMFGNVIGRTGHWTVEDTRHYCNLFVAVVGDTAKGRKGTSYDRVRGLFHGVDEEWDQRIQSGLSSGEGLIWFVRDPIIEPVPKKENGRIVGYEEMETDPGETDKRALIVESEFARVLGVAERQGNTLSPIIRDAWDGKRLGTLTKTKAARSTDPHVSIIAHITSDELKRALSDTAIANGFANRFLFVCARRSKVLPFGGAAVDWTEIRSRLRSAVEFARRAGQIPMDTEARQLWATVYQQLSAGSGGLYGAVTARAEAHARRLGCIYALLDQSSYVRREHLLAGLESWRYAEDSCRSIFGETLGDPTADAILALLQRNPEGLTRTDIMQHFQRHKKSEEIVRAVECLKRIGRADNVCEKTGGRPTERWFAV